MISLDKIITNNLEMLKSQEAELLKSLNFVRKAQELFLGQSGTTTTGKKRGRPSGVTPRVKAVKAGRKKRGPKPSRKTGEKRVSHLTHVLEILKQHGKPMGSGELITALFKKQTADKDYKHFRLLIYPVLTKAYASKTLKLKDGKIHLVKK